MITDGFRRWIVAGLACAATSAQAQVPVDPELGKAGDAVIEALRAGDVSALESHFSDAMRQSVTHEQMVVVVARTHAQFGELERCGAPGGRSTGLSIVQYRCEFERAPLTLRLAWTRDTAGRLRLAGYFLLLLPPEPAALPPGIREESVTTGAPGWPLPGTILIPSDVVRPPIAVLVHGSGANDRNETIGPNRPFLDLAVGFAQQGIASLRYDKRTRVFGERLAQEKKDYTLDDEIIDDAVAAAKLAAARDDVGPIFIVGHSEGAWLAPRIASAATKAGVKIAGIVMLAAPLTPLVDIEAEQFDFLARLQPPAATPGLVEDFKARRENLRLLIRQRASGTIGPADLPLPDDLPAALWLDLSGYDPAAALLAQPALPALLTFGERDYQVPIREEGLWRARIQGRPRTTLATFPDLNHLLMDGEGPMSPVEYNRVGHVSQGLIDRVAAWIRTEAR